METCEVGILRQVKAAADCERGFKVEVTTARARIRAGEEVSVFDIGRRDFITLVGGAAAWPLAARAQEGGARPRRIGVLMVTAAGDPEMNRRLAAFQGELGRLGWVEGRNLRIETGWATGDPERIRNAAAELVALTPDVIIVNGSSGMDAMQRATRTVPVVFVVVPDPIGAGYADSLARPGGNATGFGQFEYGIGAKWQELLKELSPNPSNAPASFEVPQ